MLRKNVTIASLYIILVIFSPRLMPVSPFAIPVHSGFMLYQLIQIMLAIFDGVNTLTGNHVGGALSWTYQLVANGTKAVIGTVPLPALAFLLYKLPSAAQTISKKWGIEVKDLPKVIFSEEERRKIKRWRRV